MEVFLPASTPAPAAGKAAPSTAGVAPRAARTARGPVRSAGAAGRCRNRVGLPTGDTGRVVAAALTATAAVREHGAGVGNRRRVEADEATRAAAAATGIAGLTRAATGARCVDGARDADGDRIRDQVDRAAALAERSARTARGVLALAGIAAAVDTRTLILDAARSRLLVDGYGGLSTRKVAEEAGVPLSQLHYHFGSKQGLILALLDEENQRRLRARHDVRRGRAAVAAVRARLRLP